ncbi:HTH-type transcriptional regulator SyrM 1 [compost metagenome]
MLETNHVELIAGYYPEPAPNLRTRFLFEEPTVCLVRAGHPSLDRPWNINAYLQYGHIDLAAHTRHFSERIDRALEGIGRRRNLVLTLSSYLACPHVVASSDLIATVPSSVATALARNTRTVTREVPLSLPMLSVSLYWHERYQYDPAHAWLRQAIADLF